MSLELKIKGVKNWGSDVAPLLYGFKNTTLEIKNAVVVVALIFLLTHNELCGRLTDPNYFYTGINTVHKFLCMHNHAHSLWRPANDDRDVCGKAMDIFKWSVQYETNWEVIANIFNLLDVFFVVVKQRSDRVRYNILMIQESILSILKWMIFLKS